MLLKFNKNLIVLLDPVKKPSIILKRYRERKQKEHEDVVNEMNYKRQVSNSIAEQKIREQAEFLKRYLNETQKEIRYQLEVTKNANVEVSESFIF